MKLFETKILSDEISTISKVLENGELGFGENVNIFETRFAEFSHKSENVAVNSASAAAFMIFAYLKETYGECDVYTTSIGFTSPAWAAKHFGHRLHWVDVDDNLLFDVQDYHKKSTRLGRQEEPGRKKVVMPILYGGVSTIPGWDLGDNEIVIIDAAHCVTPTIKSDFTFFSFHPYKPIAASDGGMISTDDLAAANWLRKYRNFGRVNVGSSYEVVQNGFKFYMNNLNATIALTQLDRYQENLETRKENFKLLSQSDLPGRLLQHDIQSSYYFATLIVDSNNIDEMRKQYPTSTHYPLMHRMEYYLDRTVAGVPKTEHLHEHIINIPLFK